MLSSNLSVIGVDGGVSTSTQGGKPLRSTLGEFSEASVDVGSEVSLECLALLRRCRLTSAPERSVAGDELPEIWLDRRQTSDCYAFVGLHRRLQ